MTRIIFFGTPVFAARILQRLIGTGEIEIAAAVTNPDTPSGRGRKLTPSPVKVVAESHGVPVLQPGSIRRSTDRFRADLEPFGAIDAGVVVAFGQILPAPILEYPRSGCINVHASLLPRWRGAAPIQRAIMAGDRETGVCLMKMEEGLDTGPVYSSAAVPITPEDTFASIHDTLAEEGGRLLSQDLIPIIRGEIVPVPQAAEGITYAEKIRNDEARISWSRPAEAICAHIHGLSPVPGAFTDLGGKRLKIFRARPLPALPSRGAPGTVSIDSRHELRVACGNGEVAVLELQLEGKKKLSAEEFIKALPRDEPIILGNSAFSTDTP